MYHFLTSGLDNVYLKNGYEIKETPSGRGVSIHDIDGLFRAIGHAILHKLEPLTGREFRFLRVEMDLSQKAIGVLMEKSDQAIAIWEKGEESVPALADKAIRDLYAESCGESPIAGLLKKLSEVDRNYHNNLLELELLEQSHEWQAREAA